MKDFFRIAALAAMIATTEQSIAAEECGISLAANHQVDDRLDPGARTRRHLSIDLLRSQYRVAGEPWRSTQELCSIDHLDLAEGETAAVSCRSDMQCGAYQFLLRIDERQSDGEVIQSRLVAFPGAADAVEVQRPRTVQLGDLRALFDAPETGSGPQRRAVANQGN